MKKIIYLLLFLCANANAQVQKIEKSSKPITIKMEIEAAKKDTNFNSAVNLLKEEGLDLNYITAKINTINNNEYQILFDIIDPKNYFDYKNLIFIKSSNKSMAAFENSNSNFTKSNQTVEASIAKIGCHWGSWEDIPVLHLCLHNGWCAKDYKGDRNAWYKYQEKYCKKDGFIKKSKTRWIKEDNGCKCP